MSAENAARRVKKAMMKTLEADALHADYQEAIYIEMAVTGKYLSDERKAEIFAECKRRQEILAREDDLN